VAFLAFFFFVFFAAFEAFFAAFRFFAKVITSFPYQILHDHGDVSKEFYPFRAMKRERSRGCPRRRRMVFPIGTARGKEKKPAEARRPFTANDVETRAAKPSRRRARKGVDGRRT
jgi:hypothetical protein